MRDFTSIEVMARMSGINLQAREIVPEWLLITYDIPKNEQGDKARRKFLAMARIIGAIQHTSSVYLMPWTQAAENLAFEVAAVGKACVWTSKPTADEQAKELTEKYDASLEKLLDEISKRLDKIQKHWEAEHYKRATKMADKTQDKLDSLVEAVQRRGSEDLATYAMILVRRLQVFLSF